MATTFKEKLLISSCPNAFSKLRLSLRQEKVGGFIYRRFQLDFRRWSSLPDFLSYDKLIMACGSVSSTHGVPGLENCFQLKSIADAQAIRRRIMDNFEQASLPTTTPEERKRLLSFVVCGGGPTGVETAAVSLHRFFLAFFDLCSRKYMTSVKRTS